MIKEGVQLDFKKYKKKVAGKCGEIGVPKCEKFFNFSIMVQNLGHQNIFYYFYSIAIWYFNDIEAFFAACFHIGVDKDGSHICYVVSSLPNSHSSVQASFIVIWYGKFGYEIAWRAEELKMHVGSSCQMQNYALVDEKVLVKSFSDFRDLIQGYMDVLVHELDSKLSLMEKHKKVWSED